MDAVPVKWTAELSGETLHPPVCFCAYKRGLSEGRQVLNMQARVNEEAMCSQFKVKPSEFKPITS